MGYTKLETLILVIVLGYLFLATNVISSVGLVVGRMTVARYHPELLLVVVFVAVLVWYYSGNKTSSSKASAGHVDSHGSSNGVHVQSAGHGDAPSSGHH